ncbi:MAG TPA: hypothetical protein HPP57_09010 [Deltaproteobacteria bacterium]|nr:hypothetical protein [Deltaproteobacteria bacterium]
MNTPSACRRNVLPGDYGDRDPAREVYAGLHQEAKGNLAEMDYSEAKRDCPHGLAISELMRDASRMLT